MYTDRVLCLGVLQRMSVNTSVLLAFGKGRFECVLWSDTGATSQAYKDRCLHLY